MKLKKRILSVVAIMMLATGITAYAAECPACEASNVHAECRTEGQHLWHNSYQHIKEYTVGGVLKRETCTVSCSEDRISWVCPNGHGVVSTMIHHQELHTCNACTDLDYYK